MGREPLHYNQILYNEAYDYIRTKWNGYELTQHEKIIVNEIYRFARMVESENEIRILDVK